MNSIFIWISSFQFKLLSHQVSSLLKEYKIVKQGGAWYKYTTADGETHQFLAKEFGDLLESHPTAKEELYEALCDKYIMKYRHEKEDGLDRDPEETITENE